MAEYFPEKSEWCLIKQINDWIPCCITTYLTCCLSPVSAFLPVSPAIQPQVLSKQQPFFPLPPNSPIVTTLPSSLMTTQVLAPKVAVAVQRTTPSPARTPGGVLTSQGTTTRSVSLVSFYVVQYRVRAIKLSQERVHIFQ